MWDISGPVAWVLSAVILVWLVYDFFKINIKYSEAVLTSSREGVDELFPTQAGE
jgi:hypothetical protein